MRNLIKHIANIFLLLTFMFSALGFSFNKHFCKNELMEISFYSTPYKCSDNNSKSFCNKNSEKSHCNHERMKTKEKSSCEKSCCDNQSSQFLINSVVPPIVYDLDFSLEKSVIKAFKDLKQLFNKTPEFVNPKRQFNSDPPLLSSQTEIPVWVQSFLN